MLYSLAAVVWAMLYNTTNLSMSSSEPWFTIQAEKNRAFDKSCLIETFDNKNRNIENCLERCLENCRCQSFQICQNTKCQLCSSHKEENSSLLHEKEGCVYATYGMRHLTETSQVYSYRVMS